ncbi:hypothetical protein [Devosia ginsengisoli]|uniref:hypothetical protein n=1 Tax=Devosia ginsengisoli TaxID=400770 RepID=UPI0026EA59E5|nr:hypothetical protein [Devosia ginsengisoli]MCR6672139.1 hypothetical protein [Devosia ginsengisoli]
MEETASIDVQGEKRTELSPPRRRMPLANVLSFVVGLVGIAAIGASAWFYSETQREIVRLSTDIAQLRVSIELFGRQQGTLGHRHGQPCRSRQSPGHSGRELAQRPGAGREPA